MSQGLSNHTILVIACNIDFEFSPSILSSPIFLCSIYSCSAEKMGDLVSKTSQLHNIHNLKQHNLFKISDIILSSPIFPCSICSCSTWKMGDLISVLPNRSSPITQLLVTASNITGLKFRIKSHHLDPAHFLPTVVLKGRL